MPGYLEGYGVGEERRERIVKRILFAALIVFLFAGGLYLFFRNYFEVQRAEMFFELLRNGDYQEAYAFWCTEEKPCPDYPMEKFMEDWGPKGPHADLSAFRIVKTRGCSAGVILEVDFGNSGEEFLWVAREDKTIGFAPWPVCNPRLPAELTTP